MALGIFMMFLALLFPSISISSSDFPITFDINCFVRIVYDGNLNSLSTHPIKILLPLETSSTSDTTISYTIQDVSNFSFAFDAEDIHINNEITIFDGYFPFFSKYSKTCDVFILLTSTFNSTTTAIQESGYGTSIDATFLVVVNCYNDSIMDNAFITEFLQNFGSLQAESFSAIYSNLAFVTLLKFETKSQTTRMPRVYAYCYRCPEKLYRIDVAVEEVEKDSFRSSEIRSVCKHLNSNGWNMKALVLVPGPPTSYDGQITNIDPKTGKGRKSFIQHLKENYIFEYFLFRMASDQINVTIDPRFKTFVVDYEPESYWNLTIKVIAINLLVIRNDVAATRGSYLVTHQETLALVYCMETSTLVKVKWDIYFTVLDIPSWTCIIITILVYAFIYKSITHAIDLAWMLLDMEFWKRHPRIILAPYFTGAMLLHWTYDSGMSTDFIAFSFPRYFREMMDTGYGIWDNDISSRMEDVDVDVMNNFIPESIRNFLYQNAGVKDLSKVFYMEFGYNLPENVHDRVKAMANKKLLLVNGVENSFMFPSLFMTLSAMKTVVVDNEFVCGILHQHPSTNFQTTHSFLIRGYLSMRFYELLKRFLAAGLGKHIQSLITLQSALKSMPKIDDVNAVLSSSSFGWMVNQNRERFKARIEGMYESLTRNCSSNKVQAFKEDEDLTL
ncbi:unnamed protein product [Orchesella dallaii]|uniref:Uncharacterized protein n=1 Tax=Orchesella dallaii TaxID=48710 RepID=A0ABP1R6A6_9HEXA